MSLIGKSMWQRISKVAQKLPKESRHMVSLGTEDPSSAPRPARSPIVIRKVQNKELENVTKVSDLVLLDLLSLYSYGHVVKDCIRKENTS